MNGKYSKEIMITRIAYMGSSATLCCVAFSALVGLYIDFSHMMNACVTPNDISDELAEMFMVFLVVLFFGSSALMCVFNWKK